MVVTTLNLYADRATSNREKIFFAEETYMFSKNQNVSVLRYVFISYPRNSPHQISKHSNYARKWSGWISFKHAGIKGKTQCSFLAKNALTRHLPHQEKSLVSTSSRRRRVFISISNGNITQNWDADSTFISTFIASACVAIYNIPSSTLDLMRAKYLSTYYYELWEGAGMYRSFLRAPENDHNKTSVTRCKHLPPRFRIDF